MEKSSHKFFIAVGQILLVVAVLHMALGLLPFAVVILEDKYKITSYYDEQNFKP